MTSEMLYSNLLPWVAQVFVIASLGALLPQVFRIRHPRTQLVYVHLVLAVCLVLPLIQPWQPLMPSFGAQSESTLALVLPRIALWILATGFVLRLGWLMAGMLRIRRYRIASTPLRALPFSLRQARNRVRASALFCVSADMRTPATVGLLRPVVLLPESFMSLRSACRRQHPKP